MYRGVSLTRGDSSISLLGFYGRAALGIGYGTDQAQADHRGMIEPSGKYQGLQTWSRM